MQTTLNSEEVLTFAERPLFSFLMTKIITVVLFFCYASSFVSLALIFVSLLFHAQELVLESVALSLATAFQIVFLRFFRRFVNNRPTLYISPEGITQEGYFSMGTIYWHEIAAIQESRFLLLPVVRLVPRDIESLRTRLGKRGKYLFRYRIPGGLTLSGLDFDVSAKEMVERIERYQARHS